MSLPNGYTQLEWIQSSGTQYVDTGFVPNQDTRVYAEAVLPIASSTQALFGCRVSSSSRQFQFVTQGGYYRTDYNTTINNFSSHDYGTNAFFVDKNKNETNLNDEYSATQAHGTFTCPGNLYIFATNNNGSVYANASAKLYSLKVYDNGALVRDFIPCKNASGAVGLYDLVGGQFYANSGTGTFTAGPEVPQGPETPENFTASKADDTHFSLSWDASEGADGYKVYQDGALLTTQTATSYAATVTPFQTTVFSVTAYNDEGESAPATLTVQNLPDNPLLWLVTDRTQADVTARNAKGAYNATDLNRVGAAVEYVAARLRSYGYIVTVDVKQDWTVSDVPTASQLEVYRQNVATLRGVLAVLASTPPTPETMQRLTYTEANDMEQILVDVDSLITKMTQSWYFSGEVYAGEV